MGETTDRKTASTPKSSAAVEGEFRYLEPKTCRLCSLVKLTPEQDDVCRDCWEVRMAGRAHVTCPHYLFEAADARFPEGRVAIELCYECAHRSGWTAELGPICNHPIAVNIAQVWGVEVVHCPKESTAALEPCSVPFAICKKCEFHRGELVLPAGRFAYCGVPYEMTVRSRGQGRPRPTLETG